jgi:hypothetical protein
MNAHKPLFTAIITTLALSSAPLFAGNGPGPGQTGATQQSACPVVTTTTITPTEVESLSFMREEEKLAHDVYTALGAQWQTNVFNNIASSEQTHTAQVKCLLDAFNLPDSALTEAGKFNNADLQNLYDALLARGATSLTEALNVGALIEETDILDLRKAIESAQAPEIKTVYESLLKGSENHLRAFTGALAQQGLSYTPQVMASDDVATILAGSVGAGTAANPTVFDFNHGELNIPQVHLRLNGNMLAETYRVKMRASEDGLSFVITDLQPVQ